MMANEKTTVPIDGALFGTFALIFAICSIFFLGKIMGALAIILGVLAFIRKQQVLAMVSIIIGLVFGFIF